MIKALRRILHDHEVVSTVSAREALAQLETDDRFDVILCDLMMPTMTGMDFYEELLRLRPDLACAQNRVLDRRSPQLARYGWRTGESRAVGTQ